MEALTFPDGKALIVSWLADLTGIPVASRVPDPRPERFIRVQDASSQRVDRHIREVSFTLDFWAESTVNAERIGAVVLAFFEVLDEVNGTPIYRPRDWGPPVELPDESGQPRYTATISFRLKSSPVTGAFLMP